jgi:hypothetical protein
VVRLFHLSRLEQPGGKPSSGQWRDMASARQCDRKPFVGSAA